MYPITVIIYVVFEDVLVSFSLQRLNCILDHCTYVQKKVKLFNHDCLPILILLYIMLAYLMLFAALSNAVCLHSASFFAIDFCKCFLFPYFVLVYCLFHVLICIMHSAFNLLVFPNSMFTPLLFGFLMKGLSALR